jgi:hypothetical protein
MHRAFILSFLLFFSFQENLNEFRNIVKNDKNPSMDVLKISQKEYEAFNSFS